MIDQQHNTLTILAKTFEGLENILASELASIDAKDIEILKRAVRFTGDKKLLYKANYCISTALKFLVPIKNFVSPTTKKFYKEVKNVEWDQFFSIEKTILVDAVTDDSLFRHSNYASQLTKDAIVDYFREKFDSRPSVDKNNPMIRINVHVYKNECTISLDSSGSSLHKRGYRVASGEAPINEVLAAGMVKLSDWQADCDFIDPMCGSGTILIEAALFANNIPVNIHRNTFAFMHWNDFDIQTWENIKMEAIKEQTEFEHEFYGYDISEGMVEIAKKNIRSAGFHKDIRVERSDFFKITSPSSYGFILTNPPYGERIKKSNLIAFYKNTGDKLKTGFPGYTAWLIGSELKAMKFIGLKPSKKITLFNGPLECRFLKFELYKGTKKQKHNQ